MYWKTHSKSRIDYFVKILPDRESMKRSRDQLQAGIVEQLVNEYLPNLLIPAP
jgi:hypothetical protein